MTITETPGYAALTRGTALLRAKRTIFDVRGPRALRVVNGLVTNSLEGLERGRAVYALALTAKGRPLAEMRILPAPLPADAGTERLRVDVAADAADGFRDLLRRSVPPIFATVEEIEVERVSLAGPDAIRVAPAVLAGAGVELAGASDPYRPDEDGGGSASRTGLPGPLDTRGARLGEQEVLVVGREPIEVPGVDLYLFSPQFGGAVEALRTGLEEAGGAVASADDWETVRIENGLPTFGREITPDNLPQETGQTERAISFDKGCYTGQEVVARIHYRGHVNRVLRGVRPSAEPGDGARPLEPDRPLFSGERQAGRLVSAVDSPRFGWIGLAYLRTDVEPGETVSTGPEEPRELTVVALPFTNR